MTLPTSLYAYKDCLTVMDAALIDPLGVRIRLPSLSAAYYFRLRCHNARRIDRKQNGVTYPAEDPRHFCSQYDLLILRIRQTEDDAWAVYFEKAETLPSQIESLSTGEAVEGEFMIGPTPAKLLPSPEPRPDLLSDEAIGVAFDEPEVLPSEPKQLLRRL